MTSENLQGPDYSPTQIESIKSVGGGSLVTEIDDEVQEFQKQFDAETLQFETDFQWQEFILAAGAICVWFILFTGGTLIGTAKYISALIGESSNIGLFESSLYVLFFWTITNIGLISLVSSILGAFSQRVRFVNKLYENASVTVPQHLPTIEINNGERKEAFSVHYSSAAMRGFGVYVLVLSGLLVLATDVLINPSQSQYVRLAGMVSVISFYAGYEPEMLGGLLMRVKGLLSIKS
ncbi:MAG: hypothetical protein KDA70_18035 [Planctomycetaceae bacterium]|nr:hypothetical protein [Planctomycetaceae bacterium]MCA9022362.1 hypothetical protein [Planctomycetaceae bacterium]